MAIRPATETDLEALLPLMRGYCEFYEVEPDEAGLREMARALIAAPDPDGFLLVAEDGSEGVVGFAACGWKWSSLRGARIVILEDLFVASESRGKGHADALIEACAARARDLGAPVMTLLTAPDNRRAQTVYERTGGKGETLIEYEYEL